MTRTQLTRFAVLALVALVGTAVPAAATSVPSSDLLLPWFEVHLDGSRTTLFALGNAADEAVDVRVAVHTNWGIPVVERSVSLQRGEVRTVNLRDWIVAGDVPPPKLKGAGLAHVRAALTGQPSPADDLFYSTQADPFDPELATGYVTFRVKSSPRLDALWGDYFWVDPNQAFAEGELLVNIDRSSSCGDLCDLHRMRFMDGGGFDGGTKLVVWSPNQLAPAPNANAATARNLLTLSGFHEEPGAEFDERVMELLPVQLVDVRELLLAKDFGWLDMASEDEIYVGVRYSASNRYSVTLQTWCLPDAPPPPGPKKGAIDIEKSTNGEDADEPKGPKVAANGPITWEYMVTNTGNVRLTEVEVTDDQEGAIDCPKSVLDPGESMTCTKTGQAPPPAAEEFQYANLATVTATPIQGPDVTDSDPSHYWVESQGTVLEPEPGIDVEKTTNGVQADTGKGPKLTSGQAVTWAYVVTNTGTDGLQNVQLTDDREGAVTCPKTTLAIGESMTCTKTGTAQVGDYRNLGTVRGTGVGSGTEVSDTDPSGYHVDPPPPPPGDPAIDVEKTTNGVQADTGKGPKLTSGQAVTWTYVVTNTGDQALQNVQLTDDREGAISCPKTTLAIGESMTCTETGTAQVGDYRNLGTVTGKGAETGATVSDTDPSGYHVDPPPPPPGDPAIDVEKATNGHQADTGRGPELQEGQAVTWTYVVTNTGDQALQNVQLTDDREGAISCPKTTLAIGESMTCTETGTAQVGDYRNLGTVTGKGAETGATVSDTDPSAYHVPEPPGGQGCTPGYWKNHTDSWPPTGFSPSQSVKSVFGGAAAYPAYGSASLLQALSFHGGSTIEGAVGNLLRAAVAGLLDSAHPGVSYPRTTAALIADVDAALASGDRDTMLSLASQIDQDNNLGCPLN